MPKVVDVAAGELTPFQCARLPYSSIMQQILSRAANLQPGEALHLKFTDEKEYIRFRCTLFYYARRYSSLGLSSSSRGKSKGFHIFIWLKEPLWIGRQRV